MNSRVPSPAHMSQAFLRKPCAIRRCAELAPFGHLFCGKHEAMIPAELSAAVEAANKAFIAAAQNQNIGEAMSALERALMAERQTKIAIEAMEANDAAVR